MTHAAGQGPHRAGEPGRSGLVEAIRDRRIVGCVKAGCRDASIL